MRKDKYLKSAKGNKMKLIKDKTALIKVNLVTPWWRWIFTPWKPREYLHSEYVIIRVENSYLIHPEIYEDVVKFFQDNAGSEVKVEEIGKRWTYYDMNTYKVEEKPKDV